MPPRRLGVALLRSAPEQGVNRPLHGGVALPHAAPGDGSGITSLCARTRGKPPVACLEWRCLTLRPVMGLALPRSAPVQGVSRPPHTASRDCRNGSPLARAIPCAPAPECGITREKEQADKRCNEEPRNRCISACAPTRSAASRETTHTPARHGSPPKMSAEKRHATTKARHK